MAGSDYYLDLKGVAKMLGLKPSAVPLPWPEAFGTRLPVQYQWVETLPVPDSMIGGSPRWMRSTIEQWIGGAVPAPRPTGPYRPRSKRETRFRAP